MKKNIFEYREAVLPAEYPQFSKIVTDTHNSFWEVEHFKGYDKDVKDFRILLDPKEQEVASRGMLAISSVENFVKTFWVDIYGRLPKPEIANAGYTIGANEVVHQLAYQKLIDKLGLSSKFQEVLTLPVMADRMKYLKKYKEGIKSRSPREFTKSLILFTLLVENVSLFSQFLIMSSFYRYTDRLVNFSDIVGATMVDESSHGEFGSMIVNVIREENPEWFDQEMEDKIRRNVRKAHRAEQGILQWIFEKGELDFMSYAAVEEYIKFRFNDSLAKIGYGPEFPDLSQDLLGKSMYMEERLRATSDFDFFYNTSSSYSKANFDEKDMW